MAFWRGRRQALRTAMLVASLWGARFTAMTSALAITILELSFSPVNPGDLQSSSGLAAAACFLGHATSRERTWSCLLAGPESPNITKLYSQPHESLPVLWVGSQPPHKAGSQASLACSPLQPPAPPQELLPQQKGTGSPCRGNPYQRGERCWTACDVSHSKPLPQEQGA